jgi:hypothetical protein
VVLAKEEMILPGMIDRLFEIGRCDRTEINLRKELVKSRIWIIDLYGAETWTLRIVDHKYLESFEEWCW